MKEPAGRPKAASASSRVPSQYGMKSSTWSGQSTFSSSVGSTSSRENDGAFGGMAALHSSRLTSLGAGLGEGAGVAFGREAAGVLPGTPAVEAGAAQPASRTAQASAVVRVRFME